MPHISAEVRVGKGRVRLVEAWALIAALAVLAALVLIVWVLVS